MTMQLLQVAIKPMIAATVMRRMAAATVVASRRGPI
jgi:hypothetical protein